MEILKIIFAVLGTVVFIFGYVPYFRDIFKKRTKPHAYTWLIWSITQGTAAAGILYGGGGVGATQLIVGLILVFLVFVLSLKYGTKNITWHDTVLLILALIAVFVWWQLHDAALSMLMVTGIDALGYIPSYRKSWQNPWDETLSSWLIFSVGNVFAIMALEKYNLLTFSYLLMSITLNIIMIFLCAWRRRRIPKPA
ncbi:MAG: hypothetical protein V4439_01865 [Patescibacteria group bacterium]